MFFSSFKKAVTALCQMVVLEFGWPFLKWIKNRYQLTSKLELAFTAEHAMSGVFLAKFNIAIAAEIAGNAFVVVRGMALGVKARWKNDIERDSEVPRIENLDYADIFEDHPHNQQDAFGCKRQPLAILYQAQENCPGHCAWPKNLSKKNESEEKGPNERPLHSEKNLQLNS